MWDVFGLLEEEAEEHEEDGFNTECDPKASSPITIRSYVTGNHGAEEALTLQSVMEQRERKRYKIVSYTSHNHGRVGTVGGSSLMDEVHIRHLNPR